MSQETVALVRTLVEAFLRQDAEVMNALIAPDAVWDATGGSGLLAPEWVGVHRGAEQGRAFWAAWISTWGRVEFDYELLDAGNDVVTLIRDQRQWGRRSGVETTFPPYSWIYTVRDGRVARGKFYPDHESALEALRSP